jgi:hypothetical protein
MEFKKSLAKYYLQWFLDCHDSAVFCKEHGDNETAKKYLDKADEYFNLINENWEAIEFFSIGDNAFKINSALPEQFRGFN